MSDGMTDRRSQPSEKLSEKTAAKVATRAADTFERECFRSEEIVAALADMRLGEWTKIKAMVRRAVGDAIREHVR